MSQDRILGNSAPPLEWRGHKVRLLDLAALATFERKVFGLHLEALQSMREELSPEGYDRALAELAAQKACGAFSLLGGRGQEWLKTVPGVTFIVGLVLGEADGWPACREDPQGVAELLKVVLKDSGLTSEVGSRKEEDGRKKEKKVGPARRPFQARPSAPSAGGA
jgi:hypothetical protein